MWCLLGGIFLGWSLGANDAANVFGTAVSTRVIKFFTAAILISIFVILGSVKDGISGIRTIGNLSTQRNLFTAFLITLSAAVCVTIMTYLKFPVSTSQALVGAIMGLELLKGNVNFTPLIKICLCWIGTPIGAILVSYLLYHILGFFYDKLSNNFLLHESAIRLGLLVSGAYGSYALGANNVANVTGVYVNLRHGRWVITPQLAALIGGLSIALGVLTYSKRVMDTVGEGLVPLNPFSALVSVLSSAIVVYVYALIGVPVSTSQAIVGGVVGIGLVKGIRTINFKVAHNILLAWLATPVISGIFSFLTTYFLVLLHIKVW